MPNVGLNISVRFNNKEFAEVSRALEATKKQVGDLTPLWDDIRPIIILRLKRNFASQGNYLGRWPDLNKRYLALKRAKGLSTRKLVATGALRDSVINENAPGNINVAMPFTFEYGTGISYGYYNDMGRGVKQREYMILDPKTVSTDIKRAIHSFVRRAGLPSGMN